MINANELRLGNWVYYFGNDPVQVIRLTKGKQLLEQPIPLTPEILEKCGFESHTKGMVVFNGIFIGSYINGFYLADKNEFHIGKVPLNCVHQLQNLYFVLTGEELKINLNVEAVNG